MVDSEVQRLLGRVRSRLWHGHLVAAIRNAMWVSAALMLLAVAAHLAARRVPAEAVLLVLSGLWAGLLTAGRMAAPGRFGLRFVGGPSAGRGVRVHHLARAGPGRTRICQRAGLAMAREMGDWTGASQRGTSGRAAGFDAPVAAAAIDAGVHGAGHHRAGATGHRACVEAASCGGVAIRHWRRDSAGCAATRVDRTRQRDCERLAIRGVTRQARAARGWRGAGDGTRRDRRQQGTFGGPGRNHACA